MALAYVSDREEVPLRVGQRVVVEVEEEVVLALADTLDFSQVA